MADPTTQIVRVVNVSSMARGLPIVFNALPGIVGTPGPEGPPGPGSYTNLVNAFVVPVAGQPVNVTVADTSWMVAGASIYVGGAGYYTVQSVFDGTHATIRNSGAPGNAAQGTVISSPQGISAAGSQGAQGAQGIQGPVGPVGPVGPQGTGITYRSTWNAATSYAVNDSVTYGGSSYVALKTSVGVIPGTDPTTWQVFAAQGATGATGATGAQGPVGQTGATGPAGPASTTTTTAQFVMPAVNGTVTVPVGSTAWCPAGSVVFIAGAGYFEVTSVPDTTHLTLTNPGWADAATPGSVISSGALVTAGGVEGAPGTAGAAGPVGPVGPAGNNGTNAFSITQQAFTVPVPGSVANITVDSTAWMTLGANLYINGAGYYQISSILGANALQAINLGYQGNASSGTVIASGAYCYAGGAPQTINREYYKTDFENGWADWNLLSGTVARGGQIDADSQGIVVLSSAAASGSNSGFQIGTGPASVQVGNRTAYFHAKIQVPNLSSATDTFGWFFGWLDGTPATFQNGVFFYYSSSGSTPNNWGCFARRAGTQVYIDSGIALQSGQWYDLEVTVDSVYATFSIAQYATGAQPAAPVMVGQISISQCPAAGVGLGAIFGSTKSAGSTVIPTLNLDSYEHEILYKGAPKFRQPALVGPAGKNSMTGTTANFLTPAIGQNVLISVADTSFMSTGMPLYIAGAGTYQVVAAQSATQVTVTNTGATGNAPASTLVNAGSGVTVSGVPGPQGIQGPLGPVGPVGQGAYTTLTSSFIQPVINGTTNVAVANSAWIAVGMTIYIVSGGYYIVTAVPNLQNITVANPGYTGNAAPGATVLNNSQVSPGGIVGPAGVDPAIVGSIMEWCGPGLPQGWLVADGGLQSRTTYPQLYSALGGAASPWGQGDGATTFNLPDLRGRTPIGVGQAPGLTNRALGTYGGEETHVITSAEMPVHNHGVNFSDPGHNHPDPGHAHGVSDPTHAHTVGPVPNTSGNTWPGGPAWGPATVVTSYNGTGIGIAAAGCGLYASGTGISVSIQNAGSGGAHNNMPPWAAVYIIIKASYNAPVGTTIPIADATQNGLLRQVSGLTTDYVGGDNTCHDLGSQIRLVAPVARSYNSLGNPTFEVDARTVGVGTTANNGWALDRWQYQFAGTLRGSAIQNAAPSGVLIAGTNFCVSGKFLRFTLTTQQGTLGVSDYLIFVAYVEGARMRELLGGASSVSVVARSSVAGVKASVALRDPANAWSIAQLATITNANAWTLLTFPNFPVWAAGGNFSINPGALGYQLVICIAAGTNFTASQANQWVAGNFMAAPGQPNFAANAVNATFDLGFAQHEPGTSSGGILDKDFDLNRHECRRYYQKNAPYGTLACQGNAKQIGQLLTNSTNVRAGVLFSPQMAKAPTMRITGTTTTLNQVYVDSVGNVNAGSVTADASGISAVTLAASTNPGFVPVLADWDADTGW